MEDINMNEELCRQCGAINCSGHICANCGKDAEAPLSVDGSFYCDKYCLYAKKPDHPVLSAVPSADFEAFEKKADIVGRMRALRREADLAGVAWIN